MEKRVQVISVCTVVPATYQPSSVPRRIHLTPFDLQFLPAKIIEMVLIYSANLVPDFLQRLKNSLARTLDFFYPIAGRMSYIEDASNDTILLYIECNNAGVEFTHAVAENLTLDDLLQPVYDPELMSLLFASGENKCDSEPLLTVHVTELAKGGFVISFAMSHVFGDGGSILHFMNSWAEITYGSESPKHLPVLERNYPDRTDLWIPKGNIFKPLSVEDNESLEILKEKIFIIPDEKIASLKQKAIEETGNQNISSLQALVSLIWKITSRYRQFQDEDDGFLVIINSIRTKITEPPCPAYYLGNTVYPTIKSMKVKDLRAHYDKGRVVSKVHELVVSQSDANVKEYIMSLIMNLSIQQKQSSSLGRNALYIGGSPKFNLFVNDFGWGRPVAIKSGPVRDLDGKIMFSRCAENGFHMEICLPVEVMNHFEKDSEFLDVLNFVYRPRL